VRLLMALCNDIPADFIAAKLIVLARFPKVIIEAVMERVIPGIIRGIENIKLND
jgi:hypothetical protein